MTGGRQLRQIALHGRSTSPITKRPPPGGPPPAEDADETGGTGEAAGGEVALDHLGVVLYDEPGALRGIFWRAPS